MIPDKLYYRIGEVEAITEIPAYVLRYWESEFKLLRPKKNPAGQRLYRKTDLELVLRIKTLLYDERLTLEGAKKRLRAEARGARPDGPRAQERDPGGGAPAHPRSLARAARAPHGRADAAAHLEFPAALPVQSSRVGAWRSPVAHLTGGQGVAGSNPVAPTNFTEPASRFSDLLFFCGRRRGDRWQP